MATGTILFLAPVLGSYKNDTFLDVSGHTASLGLPRALTTNLESWDRQQTSSRGGLDQQLQLDLTLRNAECCKPRTWVWQVSARQKSVSNEEHHQCDWLLSSGYVMMPCRRLRHLHLLTLLRSEKIIWPCLLLINWLSLYLRNIRCARVE